MDNTFVRKDFYVEPPKKDASVEEWNSWLKKDKTAAAAAKRAFTKSQVQGDLPDSAQPTAMRKINGVWKATTAIGFVGDVESGHLEPVVAENQERDYILARMGGTARGVSHTKAGNEKRKLRRARRKARKAGL
jgi:hypothetical protein